jgi:hypothetical protein
VGRDGREQVRAEQDRRGLGDAEQRLEAGQPPVRGRSTYAGKTCAGNVAVPTPITQAPASAAGSQVLTAIARTPAAATSGPAVSGSSGRRCVPTRWVVGGVVTSRSLGSRPT